MATSSSIAQSSNLETFTLIWLDSLINTSQENIDTKVLLRKAINRLKTFEDKDKCIKYIQTLSREHVVLIISGRLGHEVVPIIHRYRQLIAIYVYCSDQNRNEEWAKRFPKIKGVIIDLKELITKIQTDQTKRNEYKIEEPLPIKIFHLKSHPNEILINNNFLYFQLLIDCLSRMKWTGHDRNQLISLCKQEYTGNESELNIINEFERNYSSDRAIWWFTRESFICRMLNKAFQISNIDLLYYFHLFFRDIRRQLNENKSTSLIRTYRAQLISNQELELLKNSIGDFISINTFLSTIPNHDRAIEILKNADVSEDLNRILFEINADPRICDTKPFGDITSLNYFTGVKIILFMVGTIFRLIDIRQENDITIIHMEICSDNDKRFKSILDKLKVECYNDQSVLFSLASILSKMKKYDEAEKFYHRVLHEMPNNHHLIAQCYRGLANLEMEREDYDSSLLLYQKALDIDRFILKSDDSDIACGYSAIAYVYVKKGVFTEAFDLYNQALQIWIRELGKDNLKVAICYKNIGCALELEKRYSEAIDYYQKALAIREKIHSTDLANLHNHIASAYASIDNMKQALKHYNLALNIMTKSHSHTYTDVITIMKKISAIHETAGNFNQALVQLEKIAALYHEILPPDHPEVIEIADAIQRVSSKLN